MDDTAISPRLVGSDLALLLEDDDRGAGEPGLKGVGSGQTEYSAPDHDDVDIGTGHGAGR